MKAEIYQETTETISKTLIDTFTVVADTLLAHIQSMPEGSTNEDSVYTLSRGQAYGLVEQIILSMILVKNSMDSDPKKVIAFPVLNPELLASIKEAGVSSEVVIDMKEMIAALKKKMN